MKIVTTADVKPDERTDVLLKTLFGGNTDPHSKVAFGTVVFPPGARVPEKGTGVHDGDEYSIVLKGSIKSVSDGEEHRVSAGQATFIPAGEEHWAINDGSEDCEIVWMIVKR